MGVIYWSSFQYRLAQIDTTISEELDSLEETYQNPMVPFHLIVQDRVFHLMPTDPMLFLLSDNEGNRIAGNLSQMPSVEPNNYGQVEFPLKGYGPTGQDSHPVRAHLRQISQHHQLLVGRNIHDLEELEARFFLILAWGIAITIVLAIAGALLFSRIVASRLATVNSTCRVVMACDLTHRIQPDHSGDQFDKLAVNFNEMLDRVETLMIGIKSVSDNIAHDLRTPLTRLKNRLSQALESSENSDNGGAISRQMIEGSIKEADSLLVTCTALLRIARIEASNSKHTFTRFDPRNVLDDVIELYEPMAEEKAISISRQYCNSKYEIYADRNLIFQAFANLIDNGIKYAPKSTNLDISINQNSSKVDIVVADKGPGIPKEFHEKVVQRLFRMDSSRSTPGSGLGLSLVYAVAGLHNSNLRLEDNEPGLRVKLDFDMAKSAT